MKENKKPWETIKGIEYDKKRLKKWLIKLIKNFREEYKKLGDLEKTQIPNTLDYKSPCQIEVFWLSEPIEYQIVILTHNTDRKDMEIIINGPYKGYEFLDEIEKVMQEKRWVKAIPKDLPYRGAENGRVKYYDIFAGILCNLLSNIKNSVFLKIKKGPQGGIIFPTAGWCSYITGNLLEMDYHELIKESINEAKSKAKNIKEKSLEKQPKIEPVHKLKGYGTYFYPPVWVGKLPKRNFRQKVAGNYYMFPSKSFDTLFNGTKIIVKSDGFIGVVTEDKKQAIRILNTIFGLSFLSDIECFAVRELELAEINIEPNTLTISSTSIQVSSLRNFLMDWSTSTISYYEKKEIEKEVLKEIIKKSERISQDKDLTEQLIFLLEGYTHHNNSEYSQAFIINWLIIEKYLFGLWDEFLIGKNIGGDRKHKLTNTGSWGIDKILEFFNLNEKIDKKEYELLVGLKNKRNNFVHKGQVIDKSTSEKLLNLSFDIVKNNLSKILIDD